MKFTETPLQGACLIEPEYHEDFRGFFARTWCTNEFREAGLVDEIVQCSISFNKKKGTFRGMHYQVAPHQEDKIVSCTLGAVEDIIVDMRAGSPTFKHWYSATLTQENRRMLYIPKGFAHGFITLADDSQVYYMMTEFYHPECARGFRWNDPSFNIQVPGSIEVIHERDANYPDLTFA